MRTRRDIGTQWWRNTAKKSNPPSRAHWRYRRQTYRQICNGKDSNIM